MAIIEGREAVNRYVKSDIAAGAFLVTGDALLCDHACRSLLRKITDCSANEDPFDKYPFDCFLLDGAATDIEALIDLASRVPAQTPALGIVVRDYPFAVKGGTDALRSLYGFIPELPDTTCLIFLDARAECPSEEFEEKRRVPAKSDDNITTWSYAVGFFAKNGTVLHSAADESYAVKTVTGGIASRNKANKTDVKIDEAAAAELVRRVGTDLFRLRGEVDKAYAFACPDGEITVDAVRELAAESVTGSAFDIARRIASRDYDGAFKISRHLLLNGTSPEMITGSLVSVFSDAYRLTVIDKYRHGDQNGYHEAYNKWLRRDNRLQGFSPEQLRRVIRVLAETDLRSKTFSSGGRLSPEGDFDELLASIISIRKNA